MIQVDIASSLRGKFDSALLRRAAVAALRPRAPNAQVGILLVGEKRMRTLNRHSLGHDYTTDVLSFDHGSTPEGKLIELVICLPFAAQSARQRNIPSSQELARYVIHGCLHCTGYDDSTDASKARMWAEQERLVRQLFGKSYREP
jgi:probable rRNA maturation factor